MKYKKLIGVLVILVMFTMTISSVSAADIWIHTYGSGSVFKAAHWTSPNGFEFKDNAWILAFIGYYEITFYNEHGFQVGYVNDHMTSGSKDRVVHIPDSATKMKISVHHLPYELGDAKKTYFSGLKVGEAAMAFDGSLAGKNFHLKTEYFDSGYIQI
ncbi:MAG: hypothetical protein FWE58_03250 [Methanobrevibacter sp.]|nr:hypothetical protein [Methanobrevibacter sp.]